MIIRAIAIAITTTILTVVTLLPLKLWHDRVEARLSVHAEQIAEIQGITPEPPEPTVVIIMKERDGGE